MGDGGAGNCGDDVGGMTDDNDDGIADPGGCSVGLDFGIMEGAAPFDWHDGGGTTTLNTSIQSLY